MRLRAKVRAPRPMLSDEAYEKWEQMNCVLFEQLPENVRLCLRDEAVQADCGKLLQALKLGVTEEMVIDAILSEARERRDHARVMKQRLMTSGAH